MKTLNKKKWLSLLPVILLFLAGISVLAYPAVSNAINELHSSQAIQQLTDQLEGQNDEELAQQWRQAELYNEGLQGTGSGGSCPYAYEDILSFAGGMMGYLRIPAIDVHLPIYHGTSEEVLAKGVGHIPDTAFPIGGEGNHSVLTGHTGLPSAKIFTELTELTDGDLFHIHILDEVISYQVDQILVVLPSELDNLLPTPGQDYCTLVTCTPYGINSHRLLVRGTRIESPTESPTEFMTESP